MIDYKHLTARRAHIDDLPRLLELLADDVLSKNREAGSAEAGYVQAFQTIDADSNQTLLVGEYQGRVVAMLQMAFIPGLSHRGATRAHLETVRVDSGLRGQGIGSWLMREAIERARERACAQVQLLSDKRRTAAHRFYTQLGFVASHEGFKLRMKR